MELVAGILTNVNLSRVLVVCLYSCCRCTDTKGMLTWLDTDDADNQDVTQWFNYHIITVSNTLSMKQST